MSSVDLAPDETRKLEWRDSNYPQVRDARQSVASTPQQRRLLDVGSSQNDSGGRDLRVVPSPPVPTKDSTSSMAYHSMLERLADSKLNSGQAPRPFAQNSQHTTGIEARSSMGPATPRPTTATERAASLQLSEMNAVGTPRSSMDSLKSGWTSFSKEFFGSPRIEDGKSTLAAIPEVGGASVTTLDTVRASPTEAAQFLHSVGVVPSSGDASQASSFFSPLYVTGGKPMTRQTMQVTAVSGNGTGRPGSLFVQKTSSQVYDLPGHVSTNTPPGTTFHVQRMLSREDVSIAETPVPGTGKRSFRVECQKTRSVIYELASIPEEDLASQSVPPHQGNSTDLVVPDKKLVPGSYSHTMGQQSPGQVASWNVNGSHASLEVQNALVPANRGTNWLFDFDGSFASQKRRGIWETLLAHISPRASDMSVDFPSFSHSQALQVMDTIPPEYYEAILRQAKAAFDRARQRWASDWDVWMDHIKSLEDSLDKARSAADKERAECRQYKTKWSVEATRAATAEKKMKQLMRSEAKDKALSDLKKAEMRTSDLEGDLQVAQGTIKELQLKVEEQQRVIKAHEEGRRTMREDWESLLKTTRAKFEDAMKEQKKEHDEVLRLRRKEFEDILRLQRKEYEEAMRTQRELNDEASALLRKEHQNSVAAQNKERAEALSLQRKELDLVVKDVKKQLELSQTQVRAETKRAEAAESELKKIYREGAASKWKKENDKLRVDIDVATKACAGAESALLTERQEWEEARSQLLHQTSQERIQLEQRLLAAEAENRQLRQLAGSAIQVNARAVHQARTDVRDLKTAATALAAEHKKTFDAVLSQLVARCKHYDTVMASTLHKYQQEVMARRRLHEKLHDIKGHIRVYCRLKPLLRTGPQASATPVCDSKDDSVVAVLDPSRPKGRRSEFEFDRVFAASATQEEVFGDTEALIQSVLDGYNVCIFAYGQTGSGKTYTMEGPTDNRGVNYRAMERLFLDVHERKDTYKYKISITLLEVYNESVRDLLSPPNHELEMRGTSEGLYPLNAKEVVVRSAAEVHSVLHHGLTNRATAYTNANDHSSRSHSILSVKVVGFNLLCGFQTLGRLHLVDLAGSERCAKSEVSGDRLKEAQYINKSLSALGDVIHAKALKASHVPYRNSKLTFLLQDSLAANGKVLMFVAISSHESDVSETLSSLQFASRVRSVDMGPAKRTMVESSSKASIAPDSLPSANSASDSAPSSQQDDPGHEGPPSAGDSAAKSASAAAPARASAAQNGMVASKSASRRS